MSLSSVRQNLDIWNGEEEDELKTSSIPTFRLGNHVYAGEYHLRFVGCGCEKVDTH